MLNLFMKERTHLDVTYYLCDYSCSQKRVMTNHIASLHEGKRPFRCDICEYFGPPPRWSLRLLTTGLLQSFQTPKLCHLWLISLCEKIALNMKFLLVSYPHFQKISFKFTKLPLIDWKSKVD